MIAKNKLQPAKVQAHADTNGVPPEYERSAVLIAREVSRPVASNAPYLTASKQVSVPLSLAVLASVEVLARRSGVSRGAMVAQLAKVGAAMVYDQLGDPAAFQVSEEISSRTQELYDEFDSLLGDQS